MGRLQDYPSVTPTANDKFLIVQSQGQGLAPHKIKMDSANPTGTGSLSLNRMSGTTKGDYSVAVGQNCTANGSRALAEGEETIASGRASHAENYATQAKGNRSHADGDHTIANALAQHVFGAYNVADSNTPTARGGYVEIVGNGTSDNARSNARTLDWSGNEVLAGDLTIKGKISVYSGLTLRRLMYEAGSGTIPEKTFTASKTHFSGTDKNENTGMYIIQVHGWSTSPKYAIFTAGFSGGRTDNLNISQLLNIGSVSAPTVSGGVITFAASTYSKIIVYALD